MPEWVQNYRKIYPDSEYLCQRGSGKSYDFGTDYSEVYANTHVEDLIELTKELCYREF